MGIGNIGCFPSRLYSPNKFLVDYDELQPPAEQDSVTLLCEVLCPLYLPHDPTNPTVLSDSSDYLLFLHYILIIPHLITRSLH